MFDRIELVSKKCNKSKFAIFLDMVWCGFRYGAGYMDYDVIGFYKLSSKQRDTMLTRGRNDKIVKSHNNRLYWQKPPYGFLSAIPCHALHQYRPNLLRTRSRTIPSFPIYH